MAVRAMPRAHAVRRGEDLCKVEADPSGGSVVEPAQGQRARSSCAGLPSLCRRHDEARPLRVHRAPARRLAGPSAAAGAGARRRTGAALRALRRGGVEDLLDLPHEGEDGPDADLLIAPCNCKGSIAHVHLSCLRHWLQGKFGATAREGTYFKYVSPQCELFKATLPQKTDGCQPLVTLPQMQAPFVALEGRGKGTPTGLHVVSLASGEAMSLGRSRECDVRVNDVSLSRRHAGIRFADGEFVLEDVKSKFGILLGLKQRYHAAAGQRASVQAGRTLLSLEQSEPEPTVF